MPFTISGESKKAQIAARYVGVELVSGAVKSSYGPKPDVALDTPEGAIFESSAVARYIARLRPDVGLTGRTFHQAGQVDSWVDWCLQRVERGNVAAALATLEHHLLSRTFVVGESVTLADISLVCALVGHAVADFPSVHRWFETCVHQPAFAAVLGDAPAAAAKAPKAEKAPKGDKPKAEKAPKEEKPKAAEKPKAEKKPKAEEEDDGGDDDVPREAAKADPFAALPKSTMVLDEWKRTYSNAPMKADGSGRDFYQSMPKFWEMLDRAGYTLWHQKYKFNAENKRDFMTSNLVAGFIQRSEEVRKYAFGVMHVLNTEAPFEVEGVWLMRGTDVKAMLDCNPDGEYYDWERIDPESEASRQLVADTWCTYEALGGKTVYDSKTFK